MLETVKFKDLIDKCEFEVEIDAPTYCSRCDTGIKLEMLGGFRYNRFGAIVSLCPECNKFSFTDCTLFTNSYSISCNTSVTFPKSWLKKSFSDNILDVSPSFVETYNQAYLAEQFDLSNICGVGYRKALEFLVKDYALRFHPEDQEKIFNMPLAKCISNYIDDEKIKTLAKASAWLGNDETHYVRKHPELNVGNMKLFIDTLVSVLDSNLNYLTAKSFLEENP